jgi:hypothetical protein
MKRFSLLISMLFIAHIALAWGQTGHRVVGEIAWLHLNKKAKKNVQRVLGDEHLGMVGNWMDFIKSESSYDSLKPWHYCTIPAGKTYAEVGAPEEGDVVMAINKFIKELETGNYSVDEVFALKCLVHLVGDVHQPLHCGNGTDRGGNDVKVEYMWRKTNLHRIWDSDMIDGQQLSYTEYVNWINTASQDQIAKWQNTSVRDWVAESQDLHPQVYSYPESGKLSYRYTYDNIASANLRLLQAGVRLAGILNNIYG